MLVASQPLSQKIYFHYYTLPRILGNFVGLLWPPSPCASRLDVEGHFYMHHHCFPPHPQQGARPLGLGQLGMTHLLKSRPLSLSRPSSATASVSGGRGPWFARMGMTPPLARWEPNSHPQRRAILKKIGSCPTCVQQPVWRLENHIFYKKKIL